MNRRFNTAYHGLFALALGLLKNVDQVAEYVHRAFGLGLIQKVIYADKRDTSTESRAEDMQKTCRIAQPYNMITWQR